MRPLLTCLAVVALASCGADGEPIRPDPKPAPKTGISISGTARVGVTVTRSAISPVETYGVGASALYDPH